MRTERKKETLSYANFGICVNGAKDICSTCGTVEGVDFCAKIMWTLTQTQFCLPVENERTSA